MGVLEQLTIEKKKNIVDDLKAQSLPLFIWGCGNLAELIRKYLIQNGIQEDGFFEWPTVYHNLFHGSKVYSLKDVEVCNLKYNVIVGHSHYSKTTDLLAQASNINKIWYLFSFDYFGYNCNTFFDRTLVMKNIQLYEKVYSVLVDQKSRKNLIAFLNTKMAGNIQYIFDTFEKEMDIFNNDVYDLNKNECYWNIGGGNGETISKFLKSTGNQFKQIVTLEPDLTSYEFLSKYLEGLSFENRIFRYQKAGWNKQEEIRFYHDNDVMESGCIGGNAVEKSRKVKGIPLDMILSENKNILPPTLITANYCNGIVEMLDGCKNILKNFAPKLAIVVGHHDEYGIPGTVETILTANPKYKLYLRFHQALSTTLTLYAIADGVDFSKNVDLAGEIKES